MSLKEAYEAHLAALRDEVSDPRTKANKIAETRLALQEAQHEAERAASAYCFDVDLENRRFGGAP